IASDLRSLEYETTKANKKSLLMADWMAEVPTQEIERRYHTWAGAVRRIGEEYGWLVDALAGVARASGWSDGRRASLTRLAHRLAHGVRADALPLARLRARGLGRTLLRRLVDHGITDLADIAKAGRDAVGEVLKNKAATATLWACVDEDDGEPVSAYSPH